MRRIRRSVRRTLAFTFFAVLGNPLSGVAARKLIWNFNDTLRNTLGGQYNVFSRSPSWARTYLDSRVHLPNTRHALRVTAHRAAEGFCGIWFDFYPASSALPRTFDASRFRYLSFWIKGTHSAWDFDIKLVDARGEQHEDSLSTRSLDAFTSRGITTKWQKVSVPFADFPEVDPGSLVRFVLLFNTPGDYKFYLDDITLATHRRTARALTASAQPESDTLGRSAFQVRRLPNAMWVWKTDELFTNPREPDRLFQFCKQMGVQTLYLSLDLQLTTTGRPGRLRKGNLYRRLLERAHRHGLRVDALAGSPEWAVTRYHDRALAVIRIVAEFNRQVPKQARFDGVHFDVEPYVLIGFEDPTLRRRLVRDYLAMVAACEKEAQHDGLQLSCDVPWWFFPASAAARAAMTVNFAGKNETVGEHLLDLLPSVTIMDYRNEADGAAGIIAFGEPALAAAVERGKKIVVGLETSAEREKAVDFVVALPQERFRQSIEQAGLYGERSFEGYSLYALNDGGHVFVGLGPPFRGAPQPTKSLQRALEDLRQALGAEGGKFEVSPLLKEAQQAVARDPEWTGFSQYRLTPPGYHGAIFGFQAIHRTAPMITFHDLGRKVFEEESQSAAEWLARSPAFKALAFHYYDSLRALMATP